MQLKPFTLETKKGLPIFAVKYMGETFEVDPGQESVKIHGVNFPIDITGYAGQQEPKDEPIEEPIEETIEAPIEESVELEEPKKTNKRKSSKRKK